MTATPILLADGVTTAINAAVTAGYFGEQTFTARRSYPDWDDDFKDIKELAVDVVFVASSGSSGDLSELDSYSSTETEPAIDIAIRKRFEPCDRETDGRLKNSSVDPLVKLAEQIHELFADGRIEHLQLADTIEANWLDGSVRTHCDYRKLREGHFLAVVRVRWNVSKEST
jgi:hypothetical protein